MSLDRFDPRLAARATGLPAEFNAAGVLTAADVHVARRLAALAGERDDAVALAAAFAVRAPRLGHVHVDLATIRDTATVDADEPVDLTALPWPDAWPERVGRSRLVATDPEVAPLRLDGTWLYLDRYWREERRVAEDLRALAADADVRVDLLRSGLARHFAGQTAGRQALAAAAAVLRRLAVVAGGPGTGKTTTVARIVALLAEQGTAPLVALAAPTGKAAARLEEAVHVEARALDVDDATRAHLLGLHASTLHRLLGWRPHSHSRFRHHRGQRLPHDVVIVDETSMVSLWLMARLVEAIRPDARLVLVGDPGQLASIEAGAVLGDIVGPAAEGLRIGGSMRGRLEEATGHALEAAEPPAGPDGPAGREAGTGAPPAAAGGVGDGIVVLDRVHRFGGGIADLAAAIRRGDGDAVIAILAAAPEGVTWLAEDAGDAIRAGVTTAAREVTRAARAGDARGAIAALGAFRLLCPHRRGPQGVSTWTERIEGWLGIGADQRWYAGRPLLVTENDYELRLYNGDTGVVIEREERLTAAFERGGELLEVTPSRLGAIDTAYAMTVHKSQGSQFVTAAVLLPEAGSRILTRELLYTAATRARRELILAGGEDAVRAAVALPIARASGLRRRLWGDR